MDRPGRNIVKNMADIRITTTTYYNHPGPFSETLHPCELHNCAHQEFLQKERSQTIHNGPSTAPVSPPCVTEFAHVLHDGSQDPTNWGFHGSLFKNKEFPTKNDFKLVEYWSHCSLKHVSALGIRDSATGTVSGRCPQCQLPHSRQPLPSNTGDFGHPVSQKGKMLTYHVCQVCI